MSLLVHIRGAGPTGGEFKRVHWITFYRVSCVDQEGPGRECMLTAEFGWLWRWDNIDIKSPYGWRKQGDNNDYS